MCEVPTEAHKPLRLDVLRGMTNKRLQSFEKAEFLTISRTKFQNLLKMVCLRSGGPF